MQLHHTTSYMYRRARNTRLNNKAGSRKCHARGPRLKAGVAHAAMLHGKHHNRAWHHAKNATCVWSYKWTVLYVRPHLEYYASIWSPSFAKDIYILEKVQKQTTMIVRGLRHLPYEQWLEILDIYLFHRFQFGDLIEVFSHWPYKILHFNWC